ncbi:TolC family protein [Prosthecobacter vanneervenii]|uniref:Outer membrane protein TolC n=1 Tax=Prosthecobacter vanneervenii TaxID=48466 RepID=A0A7W8DJ98_9BACT|nr:TolC family protein [Prosthecobacter vanneervenii]MBB5031909.1 outer membrane protein TolC [Prosthecobacter vanneervenii]
MLLALGLSACSTGFYKKWADKETYGILRKKASKVPNSGQDFLDITPPPPVSMEELRKNMKKEEFLGDRAFVEEGARVINLAKALDLAVHRNRNYLTQKEAVYQAALGLTLTRQQYSPILAGSGSGTKSSNVTLSGVNNLVRTSTQTTTGNLGVSALTRTGAQIATNLTTNFVKFLTGGGNSNGLSQLGVSLTQPILAGTGYLSASETLTQAERNVIYSIRTFAQFRKSFVVSITQQYYSAIQSRETARNAYLAFKAFDFVVARETAMQAENAANSTKSSVFRLVQSRIVFNRNWLNAIQSYEAALDNLKINLGLPVTERIVLDYKDKEDLKIIEVPGTVEDAIAVGLSNRLDVWNLRDQVEDASRKVLVAKQQVLPTVNALVNYSVLDNPGRKQFGLEPENRNYSMGFNADLNLNQKPERNVMRSAIITEQQARRALDLSEETVRSAIRADWRNLQLARKQYELARTGMELSTSRLEVEEAFNAEGLGTAINLVDAQRDMNDTRNLMVSTSINYTLVRLQLYLDMGVLFIDKDGGWISVLNKEKPQGE